MGTYTEIDYHRHKIERFHTNGKLQQIVYYKDNLIHTDGDIPTIINYREDGTILEEYYFKDNDMHRENLLPAYISYDRLGLEIGRYYYDHGVELDHVERDKVYIRKKILEKLNE